VEYKPELALEALQSPLVDDELFSRGLGGSRSDIEAVRLYLRLPVAARPELSWYFDRDFYLERYPDIRRGEIDPLVHFLRWGIAESRSPHPLIDLGYIRAANVTSVLAERPDCQQLHEVLANDLVDPSQFFSCEYYRRQCSDVGERPESGLLRHFLERGMLQGLSPCPAIDVISCYMQAGAGFDIRSGLRSFVLLGGKLPDMDKALPAEWQTKSLFRSKAKSLLPVFARQPLDFTATGPPELSVIIVLHNQFALTLMALASLRDNFPGDMEVLIVDSGSTDETINLSRYVRGSQNIRIDVNIGFVRACSAAMELVSSDHVLFLNNDVELAHGAVPAALQRLASDSRIGAVGAKIIRSDGRLQEAGAIIWRDGWTSGYLRDESPLAPEANYVRDVEFCSLAFLLARSNVVRDVGGFDLDFAPAYFEDTDLCLRIARSGHRIIYDPRVIIHHLEYGSSQSASQAVAQIERSHSVFIAKHAKELQQNCCRTTGTELLARSVGTPRGRILFIEDQIPLRQLGSGFVRSNDIIGVLASLGFAVTVYPVKPSHFEIAAVFGGFPDTVEVFYNGSLQEFGSFMAARRGYYDIAWVCRTHNLALIKHDLATHAAATQLILDTEAITAVREWTRSVAIAEAGHYDLRANAENELADAASCAVVVAVSDSEAEILRGLGHKQVRTLGHLHTPRMTTRPFEHRSGILFVGAIHTADSPNYDGLHWFADEVMPLVEKELGWETRLTVVGFVAPGIHLDRLQDHPRVTLCGAVTDLEAFYSSHRIFVAPTRFAAGIPYKLHEAAAFGLPIVTTELLRLQLGWHNGTELSAAASTDPAGFARHCVTLYRSEQIWTGLQQAALKRIASDCNRTDYEAQLNSILEAAGSR
jgi:O-antigen biosynthesis protein